MQYGSGQGPGWVGQQGLPSLVTSSSVALLTGQPEEWNLEVRGPPTWANGSAAEGRTDQPC